MKNNNIQYLLLIEKLVKHAPEMSVKIADEIANEYQQVFNEYMFVASCLALIADRILGGDKKIPEMIKIENRPGIRIALNQALYRTAWVECGPISDAMNKLESELAEYEKNEI